MVYELKPPVGDSPGLLMFTHKEREFFFDPPPLVAERLDALADRYVLGMHWGRYHTDVGETPYVDVHLACPGTVQFSDDADVRRIPLCSRDFIPAYFRSMDVPVEWDVLSIGHPIRDKRYAELLDVIRMVFDAGVDLRVLLVCAVPDDPARLGGQWDHAFFEKYESLFTEAERDRIDLGVPGEVAVGNRPLHPIPNAVFPYLYNASRCFTLFSREEGQSHVVHEALLCGTPVVVRSDLRGGGRDHLDERNSRQFETLEAARDAFVDVATASDDVGFDPAYLRPKLSEAETAGRFEAAIRDQYEELGDPFRGTLDTDGLAYKLSGHTLSLPPELRSWKTNDLRSPVALARYADRLLDRTPTARERVAFGRLALEHRLDRLRSMGVAGLVGPAVRRLDRRTSLPVYETARRLYGDE
jgi:glycosyltransferase involved in cell wall biosynthesis